MKRFLSKIPFALAAALFIAVPLTGCGAREYAIPAFGNEKMLIGAYNCPINATANPEGLAEVADAGFNLAIAPWMVGEGLLDMARDAGIKIIDQYKFSGERHPFADHSALLGVLIKDEPAATDFKSIAEAKPKFEQVMPDKLFYVNLYPSYAEHSALGGSFEQYVNEYMEKVGPPMLSFDHYPLRVSTTFADAATARSEYFTDFEIVSQAAKKYGVPMWNLILSSGHWGYASPTVAELRWQFAVSMAFGTRAVTHYTYPQEDATYKSMVNLAGERTEIFDRVKAVNQEVRKWDNVYMGFEWLSTSGIEGGNGGEGLVKNLRKAPKIETVKGLKKIESSEDLLAGAFKDAAGNRGYMLVNATNPWGEKFAQATVTFDKKSKYSGLMVFEKGEPRVIKLDGNQAKIRLEAGEGKFIIPLKAK